MSVGFATFDTAIGCCGIAWSAVGVTRVLLPDPEPARVRARLRAGCPLGVETEPPGGFVTGAVEAISGHVGGPLRDLLDIPLDMHGVPEFHQRLYVQMRTIPIGETWTYGQLASRVGEPGGARAVGAAMGRNPFTIVVPCHRVVAAGGKLGGFSAPGGLQAKQRLLQIEGAALAPPTLF
ncbi:MAG: methylated-DNA--[protein]-cysteine S-methyltransferase [Acidimicrobiia bacterium]|nr:methylated-DNA--[protein]-cysteine S-methyltransferase [Acidimicrobiia bacterium]